jgi:hypothetical protein
LRGKTGNRRTRSDAYHRRRQWLAETKRGARYAGTKEGGRKLLDDARRGWCEGASARRGGDENASERGLQAWNPFIVSYHVPMKVKAEARRLLRGIHERRRYARSDNGESEFENIPHVVRPQ